MYMILSKKKSTSVEKSPQIPRKQSEIHKNVHTFSKKKPFVKENPIKWPNWSTKSFIYKKKYIKILRPVYSKTEGGVFRGGGGGSEL